MKAKVFWSSIEYKYDKNSKESKKLKGGFVYVFVKAYDAREAIERMIAELNKLDISPLEIEFVKPYEESLEWETPEDTSHFRSLYKDAKESADIVFDIFYAYEKTK